MCGAGSPRATIQTPNTGAYDRMLSAQTAAMQSLQSAALQAGQQQLNQLLQSEQGALAGLRDLRIERANSSAADTARMMALIGPPPPEKAAKAPTLGGSRRMPASPGRKELRADKPATQGPGSGLNIY